MDQLARAFASRLARVDLPSDLPVGRSHSADVSVSLLTFEGPTMLKKDYIS